MEFDQFFNEKFSVSRSFKCPLNDVSNSSTFQGVQGPARALNMIPTISNFTIL